MVHPCHCLQGMVGRDRERVATIPLTRPRQVVHPLDAVIMTQKTALSPFILNGKHLTIKDAEAIASDVMDHASRRNLKCRWEKCGVIYGSTYLLERVSGLENVSCASAHWRLAAYQASTCFQDGWNAGGALEG
jgi:hypothetical protein